MAMVTYTFIVMCVYVYTHKREEVFEAFSLNHMLAPFQEKNVCEELSAPQSGLRTTVTP